MDLSDKLMQYREKRINDCSVLQYRIDRRSAKNFLEWINIVLFHNWKYKYIFIYNPVSYNTNDQDLALNLAICGYNNVPDLETLNKYVTTYKDFNDLMDRISIQNIEENE